MKLRNKIKKGLFEICFTYLHAQICIQTYQYTYIRTYVHTCIYKNKIKTSIQECIHIQLYMLY